MFTERFTNNFRLNEEANARVVFLSDRITVVAGYFNARRISRSRNDVTNENNFAEISKFRDTRGKVGGHFACRVGAYA